MTSAVTIGDGAGRDADLDRDRWPVPTYLAENYRELHRSDAAVIARHSAFYRGLAPGGVGRAVEVGAGPNLYPLFLAAGAARRIDAVDRSAAGLAYLRRQLADGPDPTWLPFWERCRALNPGPPCRTTSAPPSRGSTPWPATRSPWVGRATTWRRCTSSPRA